MLLKIIKKFSMLLLLFVILSCGTMNNSKEEGKITLPQKISIELPKALKSNSSIKSKAFRFFHKSEVHKSIGYLELKEDIVEMEENKKYVEVNLLFISQVMEEIVDLCREIKFNDICTIPESRLSFLFDEKLSLQIEEITDEPLDYDINDTIVFNELRFTQFSNLEKYQYRLELDNELSESIMVSKNIIQWSQDKREVFSSFIETGIAEILDLNMSYKEKSNSDEEMIISQYYEEKMKNIFDRFYLNIIKKSDASEHYEVVSKSLAKEDDDGNESSSLGELTQSGGYLNFRGNYAGYQFREKDVFDENGEIVLYSYCDLESDCDMNNENTWIQ